MRGAAVLAHHDSDLFTPKKTAMADLDSILDQALDEFEEQELASKLASVQKTDEDDVASKEAARLKAEIEAMKEKEKMEALLTSLQDPSYGGVLQSTLKSLSGTTEGIQTVDQLFDNLAKQFETSMKPSTLYPNSPADLPGVTLGDREVGATMQMIGQAQKGMVRRCSCW